jgi:hypothetical protein
MRTARLKRYDVNAMLICEGDIAKCLAMVGKAVASTVPSSCSMKSALAMISAVVR